MRGMRSTAFWQTRAFGSPFKSVVKQRIRAFTGYRVPLFITRPQNKAYVARGSEKGNQLGHDAIKHKAA